MTKRKKLKKHEIDQLLTEIETEQKNTIINTEVRSNSLGNAAYSIQSIFKEKNLHLPTLIDQLGKQLQSIQKGNQQPIENILITQTQTLQALFHFAAERVSHSESLQQVQTYTDIAFKANNACRKTLLALQQIKHPLPTTFIKQQNNAINQQVNNQAENLSKNTTNELISSQEISHATVDTRSESKTSPPNPSMETLVKGRRENT